MDKSRREPSLLLVPEWSPNETFPQVSTAQFSPGGAVSRQLAQLEPLQGVILVLACSSIRYLLCNWLTQATQSQISHQLRRVESSLNHLGFSHTGKPLAKHLGQVVQQSQRTGLSFCGFNPISEFKLIIFHLNLKINPAASLNCVSKHTWAITAVPLCPSESENEQLQLFRAYSPGVLRGHMQPAELSLGIPFGC